MGLRLLGRLLGEAFKRKRSTIPSLAKILNFRWACCRRHQAVGVSSPASLTFRSPIPGSTLSKYCRTGIPILRQLSTTDKIAATLGPASTLPTWIQFFLPNTAGRIEFSAKLFDNSSSGYSKNVIRQIFFPLSTGSDCA